MKDLEKNQAWYLVEFPNGRKPVGRKWVFKKKLNAIGEVKKYKAQLVTKGYSQVEGIEFGEVFSPVEKINSIICILFLVKSFDPEVLKMDVKIVFLHGQQEEEN